MTRRQRAKINAHVVPGRCHCCGHREITWSPVRMVEAVLQYVALHDRVPTSAEWKNGTPDHPSDSSVCLMFGSWNSMLSAAGLEERAQWEKPTIWTKDLVVAALLDHRVANGRWPVYRDWTKAKEGGRHDMGRPSSFTVTKLFGGWTAAILYASGATDPKLRGRLKPVFFDPSDAACAGCGCDLNNNTIGCEQCDSRHTKRRLRATAKSAACSPVSQASTRADSDSAPGGSPLPIKEAA